MTASSGHRISEASARTGFSASALRFYEDAGLVQPGRTAAGYRTYDDRTVERLRFIARAKDLGLSLDAIAEILPIWDGDRCAAVAGELAARVADKAVETRARIADLTAFADELEAATDHLARQRNDGPCGDSCGCTAGPDPDPAGSNGVANDPTTPDTPGRDRTPIVCSLTPGHASDRIDDWRDLLGLQVGTPRRRRTETTADVAVTFAPNPAVAARVAALAAAEQTCCAFIDFDLTIERAGITLTATTTAEAGAVLDALLGTGG
jgi:DNA-binding transcriptional MerR regulator